MRNIKNGTIGGKIVLNPNRFDNMTPEKQIEIFFHEIGHGVTDRGNGKGGLKRRITIREYLKWEWNEARGRTNDNTINYGSGLNELFTQSTAMRLVYNGDVSEFKEMGSAYSLITFSSSMLAASLGISERELLYASNQSRDVFMQKILEQFPKGNQMQAQNLFNNFEKDLNNVYYNIYIAKLGSGIPYDFENRISSGFGKMIGDVFDIAKLQISGETQEMSSELLASLIYRTARMDQIADAQMAKLLNVKILSQNQIEEIRGNYSGSQKETTDLVYDIYRRNPQHTNITQEQYKRNLERDEFDSGKKWDNSIALNFTELINKRERTGRFVNVVKSIQEMFRRSRTPKLAAARGKDVTILNSIEQYRVQVSPLTQEEMFRSSELEKGDTIEPGYSIEDDL